MNTLYHNQNSVKRLAKGANYTLKHNRPHGPFTARVRFAAAGRVVDGEDLKTVAAEYGCHPRSLKNWIQTAMANVPQLSDY